MWPTAGRFGEAAAASLAHEMHPRQGGADRVREPPVGGPELAAQALGEGEVVGVVGDRQLETAGESEGTLVQVVVDVKTDRQGQRGGEQGLRRGIADGASPPQPV